MAMTSSDRLQHIDAWRAAAIVLVLACHVVVYSHPWYGSVFPAMIWHTQGLGTLGVRIFFCISGYVICRGMLHEKAATDAVSLRAFYIRRAYRILPPLLLFLLAVQAMSLMGAPVAFPQIAQATLFLCNVDILGNCGWYLGHTWSLAYEEQFYLVFPLLFIAFKFHDSKTGLVVLMTATIAAGLLANALSYPLLGACFFHFLCIMAGCMCAMFHEHWTGKSPTFPTAAWLAILALLFSFDLISPLSWAGKFVIPVLTPLLICASVFLTPMHAPWVARIFSNESVIRFGRISYGVYLWQQLATADYKFASPLWTFGLLTAAILWSYFLFEFLELPFIRRGRLASANTGKIDMKATARSELVTTASPQA